MIIYEPTQRQLSDACEHAPTEHCGVAVQPDAKSSGVLYGKLALVTSRFAYVRLHNPDNGDADNVTRVFPVDAVRELY